MSTITLHPVGNQKSFYNKCRVIESSNMVLLQSYDTIVAEYNLDTGMMKINGYYSPTTARHINAFLDYWHFDTLTKKKIEAWETQDKNGVLEVEKIEWTRINNDINGNPRYVCHFYNFLTNKEKYNNEIIQEKYAIALKRAKTLGGRKFHNKQYGGGIVFQSYNTDSLQRDIYNLLHKKN